LTSGLLTIREPNGFEIGLENGSKINCFLK